MPRTRMSGAHLVATNKGTRHSPLADINTTNAAKLQMAWSQSTGALRGHEGQPVVIEDVGGKPMMFFVSGCPEMSKCNIVQGLDCRTPTSRSRFGTTSSRRTVMNRPFPAPAAIPSTAVPPMRTARSCSARSNGLSSYALDAATGKKPGS